MRDESAASSGKWYLHHLNQSQHEDRCQSVRDVQLMIPDLRPCLCPYHRASKASRTMAIPIAMATSASTEIPWLGGVVIPAGAVQDRPRHGDMTNIATRVRGAK